MTASSQSSNATSPNSDFMTVLEDPRPGDALIAWLAENPMPLFMQYAAKIPAGPLPWHEGSVIEHLAFCMDAVAGDPLAVWLAMAHDCGKLTTPAAMLPHHYAHEERGGRLAPIWARQLNLPNSWGKAGKTMSYEHMRAGKYRNLKPGKKYNLLMEIMPKFFAEAFWKAVNADAGAPVSIFPTRDWQIVQECRANGLEREQILRYLQKG